MQRRSLAGIDLAEWVGKGRRRSGREEGRRRAKSQGRDGEGGMKEDGGGRWAVSEKVRILAISQSLSTRRGRDGEAKKENEKTMRRRG
eukprot:scaffold165381_cov28-Tisochrysis_lutea.AAC.1